MKLVKILLLVAAVWSGLNFAFAQTWIQQTNAPSTNWTAVASSADGNKLVAAAYGGLIYTSTNSGDTWTQCTNAPDEGWESVASSADGTTLVAVAYNNGNGSIYPGFPN